MTQTVGSAKRLRAAIVGGIDGLIARRHVGILGGRG